MTFSDPGAANPTVGGVCHGHASTPIASRPMSAAPHGATAALVLADGTVIKAVSAPPKPVSVKLLQHLNDRYQEILTDPSYAGQLITFTLPHIGKVCTKCADNETDNPAALGLISRAEVTPAANHRAESDLHGWLTRHQMPALTGADTRRLTRRIRDGGAPIGALQHAPDGQFDIDALRARAAAWPGLAGMDLAITVSCRQSYSWTEGPWRFGADGGGYSASGDLPTMSSLLISKPNTTFCAILSRLAARSP